MQSLGSSMPTASFFMYSGPAFPSPDELLACRGVKRLAPLEEPMAQFYAEIGLYRQLASHPKRVSDPAQAELFFVPILPHLDQDAGNCNGTKHRGRMSAVASVLRTSSHWQRKNGTDHFWGCTCVMMRSMVTNELWSLLSTSVHAVHSVPRGHASPSRCQLAIPYFNPTFAATDAAAWRTPGRLRPTLAHFRGRVMNRVRASLVRGYGGQPGTVIEAAHPSTAARCNLNKCSAKAYAKVNFPVQRVHFEEMTKATFCLVPVGDSPPSSRLYLAIAAGCVPVLLSDAYEGAFPETIPWRSFTLRFAEARMTAGGGKKGKRAAPPSALPPFNLTAELRAVAADTARLGAMQRSLQEHAADVLWEAPDSRVGDHALATATAAVRRVCTAAPHSPPPPPLPAGDVPLPGPQIIYMPAEA